MKHNASCSLQPPTITKDYKLPLNVHDHAYDFNVTCINKLYHITQSFVCYTISQLSLLSALARDDVGCGREIHKASTYICHYQSKFLRRIFLQSKPWWFWSFLLHPPFALRPSNLQRFVSISASPSPLIPSPARWSLTYSSAIPPNQVRCHCPSE